MNVIIKGQPVELAVNTISLIPDIREDLYLFHCPSCGTKLAQYQGHISKIYPIYEPHDSVPVIARCRECGARYTFQTMPQMRNGMTKVVLKADPVKRSYFYCQNGSPDPILIFTEKGIYSNIEMKKKDVPFKSKCNVPGCNQLYYFVDLV